MIKSYKDLKVWRKAFQLTLDVYKTTKVFPKEELYALTSQLRRSAISIPSNIAEGYCRQRKLEYIQYLKIAFASGAELETQILIAKEIKIIKPENYIHLNEQLGEIMKMLNTLINKLKTSA